MVYRGFTCNLTAGDCELLVLLLTRYRAGRQPSGVDDRLAEKFQIFLSQFLEVTTDGSTPTHAVADA
jgi:hypothetical protein